MSWLKQNIPFFDHGVHELFVYQSVFLLLAGFFYAFYRLHQTFSPGKRLGSLWVGFLIYLQWIIAAATAYWLAPMLFLAVWNRPERMMLVVTGLVAFIAIYLSSKALHLIFVGRNREAHLTSLIPRFSASQRRLIAVHEAGHLLVHASVNRDALPVLEAKVTRGLTGIAGYVMSFTSAANVSLPSASFLHWESMMVLAGDQATDVVLNARYLGAESDMSRWWQLAHRILMGGLGVVPWPQGSFAEVNVMRMQALKSQLEAHRETVAKFLILNKALLIQIASELECTGRLTNAQCRNYLTKAVAVELLPAITKQHTQHHRRKMKIV